MRKDLRAEYLRTEYTASMFVSHKLCDASECRMECPEKLGILNINSIERIK